KHVGENEGTADRGIEYRVLTLRQRRKPVVAPRHVHVEPVLVVEAGQPVERVDLLLLHVERVGRRAVRVREGVDAGNNQPADEAGDAFEVVYTGVAARVDRDGETATQRSGGRDEEVAVGLAMSLGHVKESAPVIGRDA